MYNIEQIKQKMKEQKITQVQLSKETKIKLRTLNEIFRGKTKNPKINTINKILDYLNNNSIYFENAKMLTEEEKNIIKCYRKLKEETRKAIYLQINELAIIQNKGESKCQKNKINV